MKDNIRKICAAAGTLATCIVPAAAKVGSTESFLKDIEDKLTTIGANALDIVAILIGLAAGVFLVMVFIESNKQQSQSKDALVRWFSVLILCLIAVELINTFIFK